METEGQLLVKYFLWKPDQELVKLLLVDLVVLRDAFRLFAHQLLAKDETLVDLSGVEGEQLFDLLEELVSANVQVRHDMQLFKELEQNES